MWHLDHPYSGRALLLDNLIAQRLHLGPMDLRPEMVFGVIAIIEPGPIVHLFVGAYPPRNRLIRIATIMPIVAIQIRQAVAEVPKRQKKTDVPPIENAENDKGRYE